MIIAWVFLEGQAIGYGLWAIDYYISGYVAFCAYLGKASKHFTNTRNALPAREEYLGIIHLF